MTAAALLEEAVRDGIVSREARPKFAKLSETSLRELIQRMREHRVSQESIDAWLSINGMRNTPENVTAARSAIMAYRARGGR